MQVVKIVYMVEETEFTKLVFFPSYLSGEEGSNRLASYKQSYDTLDVSIVEM